MLKIKTKNPQKRLKKLWMENKISRDVYETAIKLSNTELTNFIDSGKIFESKQEDTSYILKNRINKPVDVFEIVKSNNELDNDLIADKISTLEPQVAKIDTTYINDKEDAKNAQNAPCNENNLGVFDIIENLIINDNDIDNINLDEKQITNVDILDLVDNKKSDVIEDIKSVPEEKSNESKFKSNKKKIIYIFLISIVLVIISTFFYIENEKNKLEYYQICMNMGGTTLICDKKIVNTNDIVKLQNNQILELQNSKSKLTTDLEYLNQIIDTKQYIIDTTKFNTLSEEVEYKEQLINQKLDLEISNLLSDIKFTNNVPKGQNLTTQKELKANEQELRQVDYSIMTIEEKISFLDSLNILQDKILKNNKDIDNKKLEDEKIIKENNYNESEMDDNISEDKPVESTPPSKTPIDKPVEVTPPPSKQPLCTFPSKELAISSLPTGTEQYKATECTDGSWSIEY